MTVVPSITIETRNEEPEAITIEENWTIVRFAFGKAIKLNKQQSAILQALYRTKRRLTMSDLHNESDVDLGNKNFTQIIRPRDPQLWSLIEPIDPKGTYKAPKRLLDAKIAE